jgi:ATP-dependent RNA helicase DeaD
MAHEATAPDAGDRDEEIPIAPVRERPPRREGKPPRTVQKGAKKSVPWDVAKIYIGAGRKAKIRPGDIVGAIANELQIDAEAVGAIEIFDRFSLVEVPEEIAEDIIDALRSTHIKGKKVPVRRDKGERRG